MSGDFNIHCACNCVRRRCHDRVPRATWGSNFVYYQVVACNGEQYGVVYNYDIAKGEIDERLKKMYHSVVQVNGQQKTNHQTFLSIPIFHSRNLDTRTVMPSSGLYVGGRFYNNLKNLLLSAKEIGGAGGFHYFMLSMAPSGWNDPKDWNLWDESLYQENYNVIKAVRQAAREAGVIYWIDLKGEAIPPSAWGYDVLRQYDRRLWSDYVRDHWKGDTVGFSLTPDSWAYMSTVYQGNNPYYLNLHVYGLAGEPNVYNLLDMAYDSIVRDQGINAQWFIGETMYNDPTNALYFRAWIDNNRNQPVVGLIQWPLKRSGQQCPDYPDPDTIPHLFYYYNDRGFGY